ncbi:MAG: hypothetical protein Q8891_08705 [Bacteroidota bacterium]|nr:hypothetical protein [Bacteroidota bacterium]
MKRKLLILSLALLGLYVKADAQTVVQYLSGDFKSDGEFGKWTEWVTGKYGNGIKVEYRAMLSESKKGCTVTVETKNISENKINLLVVSGYDIPKVTSQMTDFKKITVKPDETESVSFVSSYCGGKNNDYSTCYSCGHEYKIYLK